MTAPSLRLIAAADRTPAPAPQAVGSVVMIGNYPPRRCGIATFTSDVRAALVAADPALNCDVIAMSDAGETYAYPPEVGFVIRQQEPDDYLQAAARISRARPDVVLVQHEFGIFGGAAGEYLLSLLEAIDRPVVSTLHTVLEDPNDDQRRVFDRLLSRSAGLVVMAERGREILVRVWGVDPARIDVVPHGAPDRPLVDPESVKAKFGFEGRDVLFTFGLLSPNKGIETVIRALPAIAAERPTVLYTVLGSTHPHLVAREGERYRQSLQALADDLGVGEHLRLIDEYTDTERLVEYLQAADIYITPYLNKAQVTSGTLSYAAALGKAIVSTPYWHAEELLADGRGRLTPFGDPGAIAREVTALLSDPAAMSALRQRTYEAGRQTIWARFAERHLALFASVAREARRRTAGARRKTVRRPAPSLAGVRRMTDSCGMLQHSLYGLPDRRHGYCVDDNARALILMHRFPGAPDAERLALANVYASFVQHAWNADEGSFRNFMSYERGWLEARGSQDSNGRSLWAVAVTAVEAHRADHRRWALALVPSLLPHLDVEQPLRTDAFVVLGLSALVEGGVATPPMREMLVRKAKSVAAPLITRGEKGLPWFEGCLSYDNARLPEALIRAGLALGDDGLIAHGLEALTWLCAKQTSPLGWFLPIATVDFGRPLDAGSLFDQQPLESAATLDACEAAFRATGDRRWIAEAERAYDWFLGLNDLGVSLEAGDGDCFDGLTWCGANENRGAESVLSFQLAACTLRKLTGVEQPRLKTASDT